MWKLAKKTLVASPTTISSSKESNSGGSSVSKIFTPSKRVASNSTTSGQGALNASLCVQGKFLFIYIYMLSGLGLRFLF